MKTITINVTHDEVFEDMISEFKNEDSKFVEVIISDDSIIMNITGTLEEIEND